ncbi:hypothetical protein SANA_03300 [Gottschalkiaceae bacterium SANA]|nr:hypothetical protein SANA_03300 [Gottschalkiaceae bacterium SANA]
MNKLAIIGLIVIVIFGISFFAFTRVTNERYIEPAPTETSPTEPGPQQEAIYKGTILEINEGSILTNGIEGIVGDVVVHLPENFNAPMIIEPGMVLHVRYDGRIAESYPMQIWATEIIATEESQLPILEPVEEGKVIPLPSHVVRFTIENAIQSISIGQTFEVVLHVNPTTGYITEVSYPDTLILLSDGYVNQGKSSSLVGVGSTRLLQFRSESVGLYEIICKTIEPSGEIAHTYTIEIEITK